MLNNQKGSVMSVAVIMIALMSFALTSVTAYSFRTAENTNRTVEENESTNQAKRLISEAMVQFMEGIDREDPEEDLLGIEELVDQYGTEIISKDREEDFNDEILPLKQEIEDSLGVYIREAEEKIDSDSVRMNLGAKAFRFSFPLSNDREMVKYQFISDFGTEWEAYDAFEYSIGSSENVVLNGGRYSESADIYGHYLYSGTTHVYKDPLDGGYTASNQGDWNYPVGENLIFVSPNYNYCPNSDTNCIDTDSEDKLVINADNYTSDVEEDENYFSDLLTGFDYDETFYSNLEHNLETDTDLNESNYETELQDKVDEGAYNELSDEDSDTFTLNSSHSPISEHTVIFQDTRMDMGDNALDLEDNSLIIIGDLTIDRASEITANIRTEEVEDEDGEMTTEEYGGQIYVFGDIHFDLEDSQDFKTNANFFSTGDIDVSFPEGYGLDIYGQGENEGMSLFAGGNIAINHSTTEIGGGDVRLALFLMAQGSIKIDSGLEPYEFAIGGAIYAQGKGDGFDDVLMNRDGTLEPFKGILINSYNETESYSEPRGNNDSGKPGVNPGGRPKGKSGNYDDNAEHLFSFRALANTGQNDSKVENLEESFSALPDFKQLVIEPKDGEVITDSSTFLYEPNENTEDE